MTSKGDQSYDQQVAWNLGYLGGIVAAEGALDGCLPEAPTHAQHEVVRFFRVELGRVRRQHIAIRRKPDPPRWPE